MMLWYLTKLLILLPILGLLIWGTLKLTKIMQDRMTGQPAGQKTVRLRETCFLGPGLKVAVIEYRGREILIGCSRHGLIRLSEFHEGAFHQDQPGTSTNGEASAAVSPGGAA